MASKRALKGQGIVEYAGAIVIAVLIMAAMLSVLPSNVYAFFVDMQEQVLTYLVEQVQNI